MSIGFSKKHRKIEHLFELVRFLWYNIDNEGNEVCKNAQLYK